MGLCWPYSLTWPPTCTAPRHCTGFWKAIFTDKEMINCLRNHIYDEANGGRGNDIVLMLFMMRLMVVGVMI